MYWSAPCPVQGRQKPSDFSWIVYPASSVYSDAATFRAIGSVGPNRPTPKRDQLVDQPGDDPFGTTVGSGRDTFGERVASLTDALGSAGAACFLFDRQTKSV